MAVASGSTLRLVRGLRVRPESFADDGPARAYEVREGLADLLDGRPARAAEPGGDVDP